MSMRGDPGQIKETNMDEKIAVLTDTNSGITPEQAARYENFTACASPKKLFIVPGADHGMSYFVDREG